MSAATTPAPSTRLYRGPRGVKQIETLLRMSRDRLGAMKWAADTYGDVVRLPLGPRDLHFFNRPEHAKHILVDRPENYTKGLGMVHAKRALGEGMLTSEGEQWRAQRRRVQPMFRANKINEQIGAIAAEAEELTRRLSRHTAEPVDVRREMTHLTLGVLGRTLLDADLHAYPTMDESFSAVQDQAMFDAITLGNVPLWVPLPLQRRFRRAKRELEGIVESLEHTTDLNPDTALARILGTTTGPNSEQERRRVRDELVTLLLAGHETTASTLTWAFHLLDEHPHVRDRLREESERVLGGAPVTLESLHELTYTTQVLHEVLRLYPPVWLLPRIAVADDEIDGYAIKAGADVLISPYLLHRHPEFWPDPETFDPERFAGGARSRNRYSYIPFGAGPRVCVGSSLGLLEATVVLATVSRELELNELPGQSIHEEAMLTLRIKDHLPMRVRHVRGS